MCMKGLGSIPGFDVRTQMGRVGDVDIHVSIRWVGVTLKNTAAAKNVGLKNRYIPKIQLDHIDRLALATYAEE